MFFKLKKEYYTIRAWTGPAGGFLYFGRTVAAVEKWRQ
jgi:hypothetical protein